MQRPLDHRRVVVTGATGYLGRALCAALERRGVPAVALVRRESIDRVPARTTYSVADVLNPLDVAARLQPGDTVVHLVGTPHPAPWKAAAFRRLDLPAALAVLEAARLRHAAHFIYVSVAQPAPVMRAYVAVRREVEEAIHASGIPATVLRPWYVLGPGHRWAALLRPLYALAERWPSSHATAQRLGLVSLDEMLTALVAAVVHPTPSTRVWDVPAIRAIHRTAQPLEHVPHVTPDDPARTLLRSPRGPRARTASTRR